MTEQEWLKIADPMVMIDYLRTKSSDRKHLLYGSAECRRKWDWFSDDAVSVQTLDLAEKFADGHVDRAHIESASYALSNRGMTTITEFLVELEGGSPAAAVAAAVISCVANWALDNADREKVEEIIHIEEALQVQLAHEVFGNPFRRVKLNRKLISSIALSLASSIYDERAYDRLPILADALQESGVENEDVLNHLRSIRSHVRGCWALDLVLGKK